MFLWTRLLLDYLSLPSLTVAERMDAVKNLNRLEGLDVLYTAILASVEAYFSGPSLANVCRLFQYVAYSNRPLSVDEAHHTVSVPLNRAQEKHDLIPHFEKSLGVPIWIP